MGEAYIVRRGGGAAFQGSLKENLVKMGVAVPEGATMKELIHLILSIQQGDISQEYFAAELDEDVQAPAYGYYELDEPAGVDPDTLDISGLNRMSSVVFTLTGEDAELIEVTAPGWSVTTTTGKITLTLTMQPLMSRFDVMAAFAGVTFASENVVEAVVAGYAVGADSETQYPVTGDFTVRFQQNSWSLLEVVYPTWGALESPQKTWGQVETTGKDQL